MERSQKRFSIAFSRIKRDIHGFNRPLAEARIIWVGLPGDPDDTCFCKWSTKEA